MNRTRTAQLISSMKSLQEPTLETQRLQDLIQSLHTYHRHGPSTLRALFLKYDRAGRGYLLTCEFEQLLEEVLDEQVDQCQLAKLLREAFEDRVDYQ